MDRELLNQTVLEAVSLRDGKGVPKDIDKAIEILRPISGESQWAAKELLSALFMKNSPDDYAERIQLAKKLSEAGDINSTIRMALCYRDGKGVSKDPFMALYYLSGCTGSQWGLKELLNVYRMLPGDYSSDRFLIYEKLESFGDESVLPFIAIGYRDGKGVAEDKAKALEIFEKIPRESDWLKREYIRTAVEACRPELIKPEMCLSSVPYLPRNEFEVSSVLEGNVLRVSVPSAKGYSSKIRLVRNRASAGPVKEGWNAEFNLDKPGLYFAEAEIFGNGFITRYYSLPVLFGREPEGRRLPAFSGTIPYYRYNYPYFDMLVAVSKEFDCSMFVSGGFSADRYEKAGLTVIHNGKRTGSGKFHYFSGVGIISDRFVYGYEDLPDMPDSLRDCAGGFVHLRIGEDNAVLESDYFGMGKIFRYSDGKTTLYSNRYHLLLLGMKAAGADPGLDKGCLNSMFYLGTGMFSEQPVSGRMIVSGTGLLDRDVRVSVSSGIAREEILPEERYTPVKGPGYRKLLKDAKDDLYRNLKTVLGSGRFDSFYVDITGGMDSRLILASIADIAPDKNVFVETSGNDKNELECAAAAADLLGFKYNPDFAVYRRLSGGYGLPVEGSLSPDQYLDAVVSYDFGTFDSSLMPFCRYGERTLHIAGWCGEVTTRSFVAMRTLNVPVYPDDTPETLAARYTAGRSYSAIADYETSGSEFEKDVREALSKRWRGGISASDFMYSNSRVRFHDDFSKCCSYYTPAWAPLMSKVCYDIHQRTSETHRSFKFAFDLMNEISPEAAELEYSSFLTNLERTVLCRGKLENDSGRIVMKKDRSAEFEELREKSSEVVPVIGGVEIKEFLDSNTLNVTMAKRCSGMLESVASEGYLKEIYPQVRGYIEDTVKKRDWKTLSSVYKKLASAFYALEIFRDSPVRFETVRTLVYKSSLTEK